MSETGILDTATIDGDDLVLIGYTLDETVVYEVRRNNEVVATEGELADAREQFWRHKHGHVDSEDGQGIVASLLDSLGGLSEWLAPATEHPGGQTSARGPTLPDFEEKESSDEGGSEPYIPGLDADEAPSLPQFEKQKEN
jgi:hypothetical protein